MANLKIGNTSIGKISIIEPPEVPVVRDAPAATGSWSRPAHWLDMPTIGSGEHKAAFLWAIPSGEDILSNYVRMGCRGPDDPNNGNSNYRLTDFTVDWGDGNSESFNLHYGSAGTYGEHTYDFSQLSPSTEFEFQGLRYRQALVVLNAASGIDTLIWKHATGVQRQYPDLTILEYNINAPSGTNIGADTNNSSIGFSMLEKARVYAPKVTSLNSFFYHTPRLKSVDITTGPDLQRVNNMFYSSGLDYLPDFETSGVITTASMFAYTKNIKVFPSGKYNFSNVYRSTSDYNRIAGFGNMFQGSNFERIHIDVPIGGSSLGEQTIREMFNGCRKLKRVTGNWDTSNIQDFYQAFTDCRSLVRHPRINYINGTDFRRMYRYCEKIQGLPRVINIPYATYTEYMFQNANLNGHIYVEDLGSSGNVASNNRYGVFQAANIKKVTFSDKPISATNSYGLRNMFHYCTDLEYVGHFNCSGVVDMSNFFSYCHKLKKIAGFYNPTCRNFNRMFFEDYLLESVPRIDITAGGTDNVDVREMFKNCVNLKNIPDLDFSRVHSGHQCFNGAGLADPSEGFELNLDFSNMLSSLSTNYAISRLGFHNLTKIKSLVIPPDANLNSTFSSNRFLRSVPFVEASGAYTTTGLFNNCYNLEVGTLSGVTSDIGYYRTALSSGAIEDVFNWLGTANKTIDIRYTPGTYQLHPDTIAIATSKGWTVTT